MTLLSYKEFLAAQESRAITRLKTASALGLAPPVPDVFGHATPPPWQVKRLLKQKRVDDPNKEFHEKKEMRPDYSFDKLVRKAAAASQEIDKDIDQAEKDADRLDKEKDRRVKQFKKPSKKDVPPPDDEEEEDHDVPDKEDHEQDQELPSPIKKSPFPTRKPVVLPIKKTKPIPRKHDERLTEEAEWLSLLRNTSFDSQ